MTKLFFSYSHRDEELRNELERHLALLRRDGTVSTWHDRRITVGSELDQTISRELEQSQIILLLVSANFLDSAYCYEKEMQRAMEKHAEGNAVVIPVILKPCDWTSAPFGRLLATPIDGKPVTMFANQDEAFTLVAQAVRQAAAKYKTAAAPLSSTASRHTAENLFPVPDLPLRSSNLRIKRTFDDHEVDQFLEDSFEYLARYFDGSLVELEARNPQVKTHFKRIDTDTFTAAVYINGKREAECIVANKGRGNFGMAGITFSNNLGMGMNSFNEILSVGNDGFTLNLTGAGFHSHKEAMTQNGAAELFWEMLISSLQ